MADYENIQYQNINRQNYSDQSYSEKVMKIAIADAVIGFAEKAFKVNSRLGKFVKNQGLVDNVLRVANTVAAAKFVVKDEDQAESNAAIATVVGLKYGAVIGKKHLVNNIENYYNGVVKFRDTVNKTTSTLSESLLELKQRTAESDNIFEAAAVWLNASKWGTKSNAYDVYKTAESAKRNELSGIDIVKSGMEINPMYAGYFKAKENLKTTVGSVTMDSGSFNITGRYADESSGVNIELLMAESNNLNFFEKLIGDHNVGKLTKEEFVENIQKNYQDVADVFAENQKLTGATFGEILETMSAHTQKTVAKRYGDNFEILKDIKVSNNIIVKNGRAYDTSIFDFKSVMFDAFNLIENNFRPIFIMNGKIASFSPLSVLGLKEKSINYLQRDGVQLLKSHIDYDKSIEGLNERINLLKEYKKIDNNTDKRIFAETNNLYNSPKSKQGSPLTLLGDDTADEFITKMQKKISLFKREKEFNLQNNFVDGAVPDKKVFDASIEFHFDKEGNPVFNLKEEYVNNVNHFIMNEKYYVKEGGVFSEQSGKYKVDYTNASKEHYEKRWKTGFTTDRRGTGEYREQTPTSFSYSKAYEMIKTGKFGDAANYIKNSELNMFDITFNDAKSIPEQIYSMLNDPMVFRQKLGELENLYKLADGKDINLTNVLSMAKAHHEAVYERFGKEVGETFNQMQSVYSQKVNSLGLELMSNPQMGKTFFENSNINYNPRMFHGKDLIEMSAEDVLQGISNLEKQGDIYKNQIESMKKLYKIKQSEEIAIGKMPEKIRGKNIFSFYKNAEDYHEFAGMPGDGTAMSDISFQDYQNYYKQVFLKEHFKTIDDNFFNEYKTTLDKNLIFNTDYNINKFRRKSFVPNEPTILKKFGSSINFKNDSPMEIIKKLKDDIFETSSANKTAQVLNHWLDRFEETLGGIRIGRLNPEENSQFVKHFKNIMMKRLLPAYGFYLGYNMADSAVDAMFNDETPIVGGGITGAMAQTVAAVRVGVQQLMENTGLVGVARAIEQKFPGIVLPFNISSSSDYLKEMYFEGKLVEVKKNRFWFTGGRQGAEGTDFSYWRPSLLYIAQHRDSGIYQNKVQKFFRDDFLVTAIPWKLHDPYFEEKVSMYDRPYPISQQLFTGVPVIGGLLNATVGQILKPTKKIRAEEWDLGDNTVLNPDYSPDKNDPKFLEYNFRNDVFKGLSDTWEDTKTWSGMPGYLASVTQGIITGKKSLFQNESTLASLDQATNLTEAYYDLDLGGLMGTTEGIRRVVISDRYKQNYINPLKNTMPDWMPSNYYIDFKHSDPNKISPFAQYLLPGKQYKENFGLNSDQKYGEYGLLDRLRILSTVAPFSKEYRDYEREAKQKIDKGTLNEQQKKHAMESFGYAERASEKNVNERSFLDAETVSGRIGNKETLGYNEFLGTDNKRYKLVGLETDVNKLSKKSSTGEAARLLENMQNTLAGTNVISYITNKDAISRVKSDNKGEYIEIYSGDFASKFKDAQKQNYLVNSKRTGLLKTMQGGFEGYQNAYKPFYMEKYFGRKDAYHSWYDENIVNPSFKDWDRPYESFVQPLMDMSSEGNVVGALAITLGNSTSGRTPIILPAMALGNFVKGKLFGPNKVNRYEQEDEMQNRIEFIEHVNRPEGYKGSNISSIYDMTGNEGLSKMKGFLSSSEKKFLPYLANEIDPESREKIYDKASDRLKNVLSVLWARQEAYVNPNAKSPEMVALPMYTEIPNVKLTNDTVLNETIIKRLLGKQMNAFESKQLAMYGNDNYQWKRQGKLDEQINYMMQSRFNNYQNKTLSTIIPIGSMKVYYDQ